MRITTKINQPYAAIRIILFVLSAMVVVSPAQSIQTGKELPRVERAKRETDARTKRLFAEKNLPFPPRKILLLAFKKEKILELWCQQGDRIHFTSVRSYPFCRSSGVIGPKRRQGDLQIPEGIYHIDRFNPWSNFYLSLGINYPNPSDRQRGNPEDPGGDIFIHGACVTIGCIPITTPKIKELYWIAELARRSGQRRIPVLIFPARMDDTNWAELKRTAGDDRFWDAYKMLTGQHHPHTLASIHNMGRLLRSMGR